MRVNEYKLRQKEIRVNISDDTRKQITVLLHNGVTPKAIRILFDVPYSQIHEIRRDLH